MVAYGCVCYVLHLPQHQKTLFPWAKLVLKTFRVTPEQIASSHWKKDHQVPQLANGSGIRLPTGSLADGILD